MNPEFAKGLQAFFGRFGADSENPVAKKPAVAQTLAPTQAPQDPRSRVVPAHRDTLTFNSPAASPPPAQNVTTAVDDMQKPMGQDRAHTAATASTPAQRGPGLGDALKNTDSFASAGNIKGGDMSPRSQPKKSGQGLGAAIQNTGGKMDGTPPIRGDKEESWWNPERKNKLSMVLAGIGQTYAPNSPLANMAMEQAVSQRDALSAADQKQQLINQMREMGMNVAGAEALTAQQLQGLIHTRVKSGNDPRKHAGADAQQNGTGATLATGGNTMADALSEAHSYGVISPSQLEEINAAEAADKERARQAILSQKPKTERERTARMMVLNGQDPREAANYLIGVEEAPIYGVDIPKVFGNTGNGGL